MPPGARIDYVSPTSSGDDTVTSKFDPIEWVQPHEVPARTQGRITLTHAKRLLAQRETNGLAAIGAARLVGRAGYLHLPTVLARVFELNSAA